MRIALASLLVAACSANHAPTWAPSMVTLGQGQSAAVSAMPIDADGDPITVTIGSAPAGLTATVGSDGRTLTVSADYAVTGAQTLVVHLDDGHGGKVDVPVQVTVAPLRFPWATVFESDAPTTREHGTFVVDPAHDVAYLVGGSGYAPQDVPATDSLWTLDLKTHAWTPLVPTGDVPMAAASRRVAILADEKLAYFYGGYTATDNLDELYRFDFSTSPPSFKLLTQVNAPPGRELHAFAYDETTETFATFGGYSGTLGVLSDTWTMKLSGDTATWTQLSIDGPSPRYGFFTAFDPAAGSLYLWSGAQDSVSEADPINAAQDTWALDLRATPIAWRQILDGTEVNAPKGRRNGAFVFDPSGPRLCVFGGTADGTTTVDGVTFLDLGAATPAWSTLSLAGQPHVRSSDFGFYDPTRAQIVIGFGNGPAPERDLFAIGY